MDDKSTEKDPNLIATRKESEESERNFERSKANRVRHYNEYEKARTAKGVQPYIKQTGRIQILGGGPGYTPRTKPTREGDGSGISENSGSASAGASGAIQGPVLASAPVTPAQALPTGFKQTTATAKDRRETTDISEDFSSIRNEGIQGSILYLNPSSLYKAPTFFLIFLKTAVMPARVRAFSWIALR